MKKSMKIHQHRLLKCTISIAFTIIVILSLLWTCHHIFPEEAEKYIRASIERSTSLIEGEKEERGHNWCREDVPLVWLHHWQERFRWFKLEVETKWKNRVRSDINESSLVISPDSNFPASAISCLRSTPVPSGASVQDRQHSSLPRVPSSASPPENRWSRDWDPSPILVWCCGRTIPHFIVIDNRSSWRDYRGEQRASSCARNNR